MQSLLFSADMMISVLLAVLLSAVIAMAWRLDRRLKTIRDSSGELNALIKDLNTSAERAYQAVSQLRAAAKEHQGGLENSISKARALSDELSLITQSADSLASRLTGVERPTVAQKTAAKPNSLQMPRAVPAANEPSKGLAQPQTDDGTDDGMDPSQDGASRAQLRRILSGVR